MGNSSQFGKYLLVERIGVGGMAEVFKAKTFGAEGFERLLAIKRILPHLIEDTDFVSMFIDEAKIAVRLQHPNIVTIHDLGRAEGTLFIAMELVQGRDLRAVYDVELKRNGRVPVGVATHVIMKMCEALHHAHFATGSRGEPLQVIHRDVSPQNVMLSFDGEVKVADFGLAKARGRMVQTQAGVVKGKLAYMSPEQLRGDEIDHRVDVFGLGIVLFELLTGTRLFLGPTDMDTLRRVYDCTVPPMRELNPTIHPDLEAIVRRALAKDRDLRYGTALELHDDLQFFAYSNDCYGTANALRSYLREVFPDAAPLAEDDLPPFAAPAPLSVAPGPTLRPPARDRVATPMPAPPAPPMPAPAQWAAPPAPAPAQWTAPAAPAPTQGPHSPPQSPAQWPAPQPPAQWPAPQPPAAAYDPRSVLTQRVVNTGYPAPPERSGVASSLPEQPLGLYDEDVSTEQVALEGLLPAGASPTSPAPAPDELLGDFPDWDDGPTMHSPPEVSGSERRPDQADLWDDDETVVVDPRRGHGS